MSGPSKKSVAGAEKPVPAEVTFESPARQKRVYGPDGVQRARFDGGVFVTSDEELIAVLDGLPDVRRA